MNCVAAGHSKRFNIHVVGFLSFGLSLLHSDTLEFTMDTPAFYISECKSLRNSLSESQATVAAIEVEKRGLLEMNAALRETVDHLTQQLAEKSSPVRPTLRSGRQRPLRNYTGSDDSPLIKPVSIFIFYIIK